MKLKIHDSITILEPLFCVQHKPKDLLSKTKPIFFEDDSPFRQLMPVVLSDSLPAQVLKICNWGVSPQQGWGLFNPNRKVEASQWVFERFYEEKLFEHAQERLELFADIFSENALPEVLNVFLLPADPANRITMLRSFGSAFFATKDMLIVQLWPSQGNVDKLGALLARAFAQLIWQRKTEPKTLKDMIEQEGFATEFVAQHYPDKAETWALSIQPAYDWDDALRALSQLYGVKNYDDIPANVYGTDGSSIARLPPVKPLEAEELEYAQSLLQENLTETEASKIAALLYGDDLVTPQGYMGQGMPNYAALELAYAGSEMQRFSHLASE